MGALQPWHWIVLLVVVLLLFGSSRLPGLAKSVGQSMKIFKKEVSELRDDKPEAKFEDRPDATSRTADGTVADRTTDAQTGTSTSSLTDKGGDAPKA